MEASKTTVRRARMRPLGIHCRQAIVKSPRGAHRPKPCKLAGNAYLCRAISAKLIRKWPRNKSQAG
jgi:hypothetical protein